MTKTQCIRGHEIAAVGRSAQRMCRACLRAWDRERNARRRQDPAYLAAEQLYKVQYDIWRGSMLKLHARMDQAPQRIDNMVAWANALVPGLGDELRFTPKPREPWNGDPHHIGAPPGRYRSRPGYPRVTREVVERIRAARNPTQRSPGSRNSGASAC